MTNIRDGLVYKYLKNRNEDEFYTHPCLVAGYWLYHAEHNPLREFDNMVKDSRSEDDSIYKEARGLIIEAINQ